MTSRAFHHVGCAVRDIEASLANYRTMLAAPRCSRVFAVASQRVRVCFIELAPATYLELIEASAPGAPIERYYAAGFYHLGFLVDDLGRAVDALDRKRYRPLPPFASEAFDGRRCQFVVTPEAHLIELAEMTSDEFTGWFAASAAGQIA